MTEILHQDECPRCHQDTTFGHDECPVAIELAANDLYVALKGILEAFGDLGHTQRKIDAVTAAVEAIAKAEGRTP